MNFKTMICVSAMTLTIGQAYSQVETCGTEGDIQSRIEDCAQISGGFALVSKTSANKKVHMELKTGLLWSETISGTMNHEQAVKACHSEIAEVAGLSDLVWKLPTIEQYESADKNGFKEEIPGASSGWFWSATQNPKKSYTAKMYLGSDGSVFEADRHYDGFGSVKCVAETK